ncbi:hypothetical protein [Pseudophaeobacter sp.]|uniref:hypothetical protein n=1 Tax=Pseudophaeobacter sp. TaxID=1971739 RepID=UPI0032977A9B
MTDQTDGQIGVVLTTTAADLSVTPAGKVRKFLSIQAANVNGVDHVDVTVQWTDASSDPAHAVTRLAYQLEVPAKDGRPTLTGPFSLSAGNKLQGLCSADGDAELTIIFYDEDAV